MTKVVSLQDMLGDDAFAEWQRKKERLQHAAREERLGQVTLREALSTVEFERAAVLRDIGGDSSRSESTPRGSRTAQSRSLSRRGSSSGVHASTTSSTIALSSAHSFLEGDDEVVIYRPAPMHMDLSMALAAGSKEELDSMVAAQAAVSRSNRSTGIRYTRRRRRLSKAGSRLGSFRRASSSPTHSGRSNPGSRRGSLKLDGSPLLRSSGRSLSVNRGNVADVGSTLRKGVSADDFAEVKEVVATTKKETKKGTKKGTKVKKAASGGTAGAGDKQAKKAKKGRKEGPT
eukprot:CAMPEP_0170750642 /NCGR_PEP_ID=MMETSP0437-20130122/11037_1 /TAXON_ID=0 /ORGANISM="Sexangularia sp." /LENGTH=287 /DNA_ID=CAMNT_0011089645 /DNA_START=43 /DNA_END=902 /DNA_ORIENTATION=-